MNSNGIGSILVAQHLLDICWKSSVSQQIVFISSDFASSGKFLDYEDGIADNFFAHPVSNSQTSICSFQSSLALCCSPSWCRTEEKGREMAHFLRSPRRGGNGYEFIKPNLRNTQSADDSRPVSAMNDRVCYSSNFSKQWDLLELRRYSVTLVVLDLFSGRLQFF